MSALDYWTQRYATEGAVKHHSEQNRTIARDFLRYAKVKKPFATALQSHDIIEIGCGTGELAYLIKETYGTGYYMASDFSRDIVKVAQRRFPVVNYWVLDILKDPVHSRYDLAIASNVLEHFSNPYAVIDKMMEIATQSLVIVPYKQPVTDDYDAEGGAGHVFRFDEYSFLDYKLVDHFTFKTKGWNHSSNGEDPIQLAVLLGKD